jgi:hypothetical protein
MPPPPPWLAAQLAALDAAGVRVSRLRAGGPADALPDRFAADTPFCSAHVACEHARWRLLACLLRALSCVRDRVCELTRAPCVAGEVVLNAGAPATPPDVHCVSQPSFAPLSPPEAADAQARACAACGTQAAAGASVRLRGAAS